MSVYRKLSTTQKQQLDQAQIAWLKTRDDKCHFEHDGPMNNTVVYGMINADICVANETQQRSKYLINSFNANKLSTNSSAPFQKIRTAGGGDITYYKGEATVSGTIDVTDPDDEYTPCGLCFSVDQKDASQITRESGDDRSPWFAFDNSYYNNKSKGVLGLKLRIDKCYEPINATIKIKNYKGDRVETETVDETTLVKIISMDTPKIKACSANW